jgi:hypothetical protein
MTKASEKRLEKLLRRYRQQVMAVSEFESRKLEYKIKRCKKLLMTTWDNRRTDTRGNMYLNTYA